ncbi:MAG: bifunctional folylpolyglutamate synthase/dihydrofolate synthase [Rhodospirillaceae bacterium]|nr:bifunctional folylpolyglutamate synthase/dihydrofolate synthase [Rhodospirillaceae bacterium]
MALHPKKIDLSLGRMYRLLGDLGNPHLKVPPVIHVAGTNGKGSTVAFLKAILEAADQHVHTYTSPHLVRFNERIGLAGATIGDDALAEVLDRCEQVNGGQPITFFEVTTCAAFLAFAEVPADVLVLEVGLGGRLDATNVIERPVATAITRISMDHMQFLGDTLAAIAGEKAGILKAGVPAVIGPQPDAEVRRTLDAAVARTRADGRIHGRDWTVEPLAEGFRLTADGSTRDLPAPALLGRHQLANAATAVLCADCVLGPGGGQAIREGLGRAVWPGRLQRLTRGPAVAAAPPGWEVWLDGGHNDSAGDVLAAWLDEMPAKPLLLVVGMLESKDPAAFLAPLARHAESVAVLEIPGQEASFAVSALVEHARAAGISRIHAVGSVAEAVGLSAGMAGPGRVLITGSLYLAGSVLAENG